MIQRRVTILLAVLIAVVIGFALMSSGTRVPESAVLVVELSGDLPDSPASDIWSRLGGGGLALPTLSLQLEKAAADARIEGVLLHIRGLSLGPARRRELHDSIGRLRDSGKKVVALLDLGQIGASNEIYVASAATEVYVVPGFLGPLTGMSGELMLLGGLLDQVGVAVEYERIGAYKSAPESYAESQLSAPAREMYTELMDGLFADLVDVVAKGRKIEPVELRAIIDRAPGTANEWIDAGLADGIAGRESVLEAAGWKDIEEIGLDTYLHVDPQELGLRTGPKIALIFAEGAIVPGSGGASSFGADRVSEALRAAGDEEAFRAIVLRINSGGGSPLASDQIWRAVRDVQEKKPVIVSMGDAAASGGYYVASAARQIVAQPTTQTGSIGVFILRPSLGTLLEKVGVRTERMTRGALAGLATSSERLTNPQRELLRKIVRSSYDEFLGRVSTGREVPKEAVDRVGQGRVWLGSRALEHDLVDALGGLETAVDLAKEASGIAEEDDPQRVIFPKPPALQDQIRELLQSSGGDWFVETLLPQLPAQWRGLSELHSGGLVQLAPYWLQID